MPAALLAILSKYVVLTRMQPGCRNVDLCGSVTAPGRYLSSRSGTRRTRSGSTSTRRRWSRWPQSCRGVLAGPPDIDLWDGASAHDLA